jgi:hypothetical protein
MLTLRQRPAACGARNGRRGPLNPSCPGTQSPRQQQDNQHEEDDSAQTTPDCRATDVETASAEQQQQDYQHNQ